MKPFVDVGQFRSDLPSPETSAPRFSPRKNGFGTEIRYGRDLKKRNATIFISSGKWAEMQSDGLIDQEVAPGVIGELIDPLDLVPFSDATERKSPETVLTESEIISGQSLDYEGETSKDGRITIFDVRPRGYVVNEEIPHKTRGPKVETFSYLDYSSGNSTNPFMDGGGSLLGIPREGFYGSPAVVKEHFYDRSVQNTLGIVIYDGDYSSGANRGTHGFDLYSSEFGVESLAFLGLLK